MLSLRNLIMVMVLIDKIVDTNGVKIFLTNPRQFVELRVDPNKELNFILNCEQKVIDIIKEIKYKNQIRISTINHAQLVVKLGSFMVLQKSIKIVIDGFPAFRPIPSATRTPK